MGDGRDPGLGRWITRGVLLSVGILAAAPFFAWARAVVVMFAVFCLPGVILWLAAAIRIQHPGHGGQAAPTPEAVSDAWRAARSRFAVVRAEYAAFECNPTQVLELPALSDVSVASTARFVEAFADAQALETETMPPPSHGATFVAAVEYAERAWSAARDAAGRVRLSGLPLADRASVERVIKILAVARDTDNDPERYAAYARARAQLARLERTGAVHLPPSARAVLDAAARGALPAEAS